MFIIGLTGGIGTGKTEVAKLLRDLGAEVIGADGVAHEVYKRGAAGWKEVVAEFGEGVLAPDGEVDRAKLGAIVFQDDRARTRLNAIVHPKVRTLIESRIGKLGKLGSEVVVVEAALLVEAKQQEARWASLIDEVWVTDSPEDQVVERIRARDSLDNHAIRERIRSQIPREERLAHADVVIDNSGSPNELRDRVQRVWQDRVIRQR